MTVQGHCGTPIGALSMRETVKGATASRAFRDAPGFAARARAGGDDWQIVRGGTRAVELVRRLFERLRVTFNLGWSNPGWTEQGDALSEFEDIPAFQAGLQAAGTAVDTPLDPAGGGPADRAVRNACGNPAFFDRHLPAVSAWSGQ